MVKSVGGQRESDGVVVPLIGARQNAPGGTGPDFGHASGAGKHQGMAGTARNNIPGTPQRVVAVDGAPSGVTVRELQRRLWAAAKQREGRRFRTHGVKGGWGNRPAMALRP